MGTAVKTWAFAADAEGLADAGNAAQLTFAHDATDGNPSGCVKFTCGNKSVSLTEFARNPSTGETWESWGVPAGATVTDVQITAWDERCADNLKLTSHAFKARVIGSGGGTVHSAGDLLDVALGTTTDATWQAGAAGTSRAVDASSQASTTDVRLELEYAVVTGGGGGGASTDQRFDQIALTITYSATTTVATGMATESETALGLATTKIAAVGLATETETALAPTVGIVGGTQEIQTGLAIETESALAVSVTKLAVPGIATETGTTLAPSVVKLVAAGAAVETNSALGLSARKLAVPGIAIEVAAALALTLAHMLGAGVSLETDAAVALSATKLVAVGAAAELDTALALSTGSTATVPTGTAIETDGALELAVTKRAAVGLASEADVAQALLVSRLVALGLAVETDAAAALQTVRVVASGAAIEADSALGLAAVKVLASGVAAELDTALALALPFNGQIGLALEVSAALGLSVAKLVPVGLATELEAPLAPALSKWLTVGLATEVDAALSPFGSTTYIATGQAAETDAALGLSVIASVAGPGLVSVYDEPNSTLTATVLSDTVVLLREVMLMEYTIGSAVTLRAQFKNAAGVLTNPTAVLCKIRTPAGTEVEGAPVSNPSTGTYEHVLALTQAGSYIYRWVGTGAVIAAAEGFLTVLRSSFQNP